jgi:hypothetical protein
VATNKGARQIPNLYVQVHVTAVLSGHLAIN